MSITYQVEKLVKILPEVTELIKEHWKEIAHDQDKIKLNPNWGKYIELEQQNIIHIITVREKRKIIGYNCFIVMPHLHHRDHIFAVNDVLFLKKEYRKGMVGIKLIKRSEQYLSLLNVSKIYITSKVNTTLGKLLPRLGYEKEEENYSKYIGD